MILQGAEFLQAGAFNDWQELQWENTSKFSGIVDAHRHLIHLRQNRYKNTVGLTGEGVEILHHDTTNNVITYRRYTSHKPEDDVVVIANFSDKHFSTYDARFPRNSKWTVRFNSTWKGYSADFPEVTLPTLNVDNNCVATIELAPYSAYILSEEK